MPEVAGIPTELVLPTFSTRLLGRLVVFVNRPGFEIADDDWATYVQWLKSLQSQQAELAILTAAGGRAPSSAQRSMISRELKTDALRIAVLLSDPKLLAIVRVTSWFMRGTAAFKAHEIDKALEFLGAPESSARVRMTIRELGGVVFSSSAAG
ncbi:MAG: hypothetical protein EOO73_24475 [Myxococcales bacterium]|nr:MAG: hypothetical protein EOO73_24475 [Myxococcales bacterium]